MSEEKAEELGFKPLARFITYQVSAVPAEIMGIAPAYAIPKSLKKANLTLEDIKLIELNEAFATQIVAVLRELEIPLDKLNVNGGAISLGHPLGATGSILTVKLIYELRKRGGGYGIISACVGGGMGASMILEVYGS
jgi:acetyl-CoA acyltransferase